MEVSSILEHVWKDNDELSLWKIGKNDFIGIEKKYRARGVQSYFELLSNLYTYYLNKNEVAYQIPGDKSPYLARYSVLLRTLFPKAFFIYLVRDGRDVVSSMREHFPMDLKVACDRWIAVIKSMKRSIRMSEEGTYKVIRYEDLVNDQGKTITDIAVALELEFTGNEEDVPLDDLVYNHQQGIHEPIHRNAVGKYKVNLSKEEIKYVEKRLRKYLHWLGYQAN